ncbi:MAG: anti-sigma factor [Gammaproteobacteria bacterium]
METCGNAGRFRYSSRRDAISQARDVVGALVCINKSGYEQVSGDVVWSSGRQMGYLRLSGLPVNNPARSQYQLWIVDAHRDGYPVSGGLFDVMNDDEMIIPVDPYLPVYRPTAFAVTLEKSGGVVVSDGPMLLVAAIGD